MISPLYHGHLNKNQLKSQLNDIIPDSSYKDPFYKIHVNTANLFSSVNAGSDIIYATDLKYIYFIRKIPRTAFSSGSGGAIIISMNENIFHKEIKRFFPVNTEILLISTDGKILLSSNKSQVYNNLSSLGIDINSKLNRNDYDQGNFIQKINGVMTLVSYKKSSYSNYIYVAFSPLDNITSNFSILYKLFAVITLLTFVLGIILSFYSVKIYLAPLFFLKNLCSNILNKYSPGNKPNNEFDIINYTVDVLENRLNEREVYIKEISPIIFEHILTSLIKVPSSAASIKNKLRIAGIKFDKSAFIIIIFKVKYENPILASNLPKRPEYINREIIELVNKFFNKENVEYISARTDDHLLLLFNIEPDYNLLKTVYRILEHLSKFTGINTYLGISDLCYSIDNINIIYQHAREAIKYNFIFPDSKIFLYDTIKNFKNEHTAKTQKLENYINQILSTLQSQNWNKLNSLADKLGSLIRSGNFYYEDVIKSLKNLIESVYNYMLENNILPNEIIESPEKFMQSINNIDEFCDLLKHLISYISNIIQKRRNNKNYELIEQVKEYIIMNISSDNISLDNVSRKFEVSSAHLSRTFKEITNMNFIEFVTHQKLEYAMNKLINTNLTVDAISKLIGYSNTQYFISKFKEKYGKTPNRFRLIMKELTTQDSIGS